MSSPVLVSYMEEATKMEVEETDDSEARMNDAFHAILGKNIILLSILLNDYHLDPNGRHAARPGQTLLGTAARLGFTIGVKVLLEKGARTGDLIEGKTTALHLAVQSGSLCCATELVKAKADVNACAPLGSCATPLHFALSAKMARMLISNGADIYSEMSKAGRNWSPAFSALFNEAFGAFREILREDRIKSRKLLEVRDYNGMGLGHAAAAFDSVVPLALLSGYGLSHLSTNSSGRSVLEMCISPMHREVFLENPEVLFRRMEALEIR